MFVFKAGVVGAGTMGAEIAQLIAAAGIPVVLRDVEQRLVDVGRQRVEELTAGQLDALVSKERLTRAHADEQLARTLALCSTTTSYDGFGDVDLVIEAVPEQLDLKRAVFVELDAATPGHAILASNTSALSISELASVTTRAERVLGFHFFYPASVMRLVEIVEGIETSPEAMAAAARFAATIRKTAIRCADDPGFVVNRVLTSAISELWRAQEEQGLSIEALDRAITASKAAPMGPFQLADLLGLDTVLHVAEQLREAFGERFYVHGAGTDSALAAQVVGGVGGGQFQHGPHGSKVMRGAGGGWRTIPTNKILKISPRRTRRARRKANRIAKRPRGFLNNWLCLLRVLCVLRGEIFFAGCFRLLNTSRTHVLRRGRDCRSACGRAGPPPDRGVPAGSGRPAPARRPALPARPSCSCGP